MARLVTIEGVPVPRGVRKKPGRLVRGRRLKTLVKAIEHMQTLANQDSAEATRAFVRGYTPYLILGNNNSATMRAFNTVLNTLKAARTATA
ncbi:MAG: hypothetical protein JOZ10_16180 [Acidobacteria bacterium]|nr:hypothetical protein [Acidobacteriota bacterium]